MNDSLCCPHEYKSLCTIRQPDLEREQVLFEVYQRYGKTVANAARVHFNYRTGWVVYVPADVRAVERN